MNETVLLNRKDRRKLEKKFHIESEKLERINKGDCYGCGKPVFVAQGQLYKLRNGQPSHKECRLSTGKS